MKETITLNLPPFSINKMTYRDKRHKTQDFKEWMAQFFNIINKSDEALKSLEKLREKFDPKQHYIIFTMISTYPEELFWTQEGKISGRTQDISNVEKPILDFILNKSFYDKKPPYGVKNVNTDDKYVCDLHSYKRPGSSHQMILKVEVKSLKDLDSYI